MSELAPIVNNIGKENLSRYFSNNAKNANKLLETIEEAKETIEIYKDADFTASTEKTNEILAVLTLIFTFTIPPTVIGTFFGMNILLPGGIETGPWLFLGKYTTLILIITLSILFVSAMFWYFKKKKWF
jgi:magnesium transporter